MTRAQIDEAVKKFVDATEHILRTDFAGVELHGSHGYLISSLLSYKKTIDEKMNMELDQKIE